ncbi:unnamed protein product, partial [Symbiodinium sp. KB8]
LAQGRQWQRALQAFGETFRGSVLDLTPNRVSYFAVFCACLEGGRPAELLQFYQEMESQRVELDATAAGAAVDACEAQGQECHGKCIQQIHFERGGLLLAIQSIIYLEGVHRFVDHKLNTGSIVRTERDGDGTVWWIDRPSSARAENAIVHKVMECEAFSGAYVARLIRRSKRYNGDYNWMFDNCGDYMQEIRHQAGTDANTADDVRRKCCQEDVWYACPGTWHE